MRSLPVRSLFTLLLCALAPLGLSVHSTAAGAQESANSGQPTIKVYKYRNDRGVPSFSDRAPRGTRFEVLHYNCYACDLARSEEHTTELQSRGHLVCRLLLE